MKIIWFLRMYISKEFFLNSKLTHKIRDSLFLPKNKFLFDISAFFRWILDALADIYYDTMESLISALSWRRFFIKWAEEEFRKGMFSDIRYITGFSLIWAYLNEIQEREILFYLFFICSKELLQQQKCSWFCKIAV